MSRSDLPTYRELVKRVCCQGNLITALQAPLPVFDNDADAIAGGLTTGDRYQLGPGSTLGADAAGIIRIVQ